MNKKIISFSIFFLSFFFFNISSVQRVLSATVLNKNISLGDSGVDVLMLQIFLNRNEDTRIAESGPGSIGNETGYFGILTKQAVIRFQELHSDTILWPLGLERGTGFVGASTRLVINNMNNVIDTGKTTPVNKTAVAESVSDSSVDIYQTDKKLATIQDQINTRINAAIASKSSGNIDISDIDPNISAVYIKKLSSHTAVSGTDLLITGSGFATDGNDVYFGPGYVVKNVPLKSGVLAVRIPAISSGRYDIAVKNTKGISNTDFFVITSVQSPKVVIESVEPQRVSFGQTITLKGSGFALTGNEIRTTFQTIKNISSTDGKTLTFKVEPESLREASKLGTGKKEYQVEITVLNDNGVTDTTSFFTFVF